MTYYSPKLKHTQTLLPCGDGDVSVVLMCGGQLEHDAVMQQNLFHKHNNSSGGTKGGLWPAQLDNATQ